MNVEDTVYEEYINLGDIEGGNAETPSPASSSKSDAPGKIYSHGRASNIDDHVPLQRRTLSPVGIRMRPSVAEDKNEDIFEICYESEFDYRAQNRDELDLKRGSVVRVVKDAERGWVHGIVDGKEGLVPSNYIRAIGTSKYTRIRPDEIELISMIGEGAVGEVYRARYDEKDIAFKKFKVKVMEGERKSSRELGILDAVKHEAAYFSSLEDSNIVGLIGVCTDAPMVGLALELCQGGSLTQVYRKVADAAVPKRILIGWAIQIASAMECIATKFIHRDLKMDNVLVLQKVCFCALPNASTPDRPNFGLYMHEHIQPNGVCRNCEGTAFDRLTLKLTDFGLTREGNNSASENRLSVGGTSAYIAPEAYIQASYTEYSDVWSFGVVLWELITRRRPYENADEKTIPFLVAIGKISLPIAKEFPSVIADLITRCQNRIAHERPRFSEIIRILDVYLAELLTANPADYIEQKVLEAQINDDLKEFKMVQPYLESNDEMKRLYEQMKAIVDRSAPMTPPETAKRNRANKIDKHLIGAPQDPRHVISLGPSGGTLPRKLCIAGPSGGTTSETLGHMSLKPTLSKSHPNLNQISPLPSTPSRSGAIRKKREKAQIEPFLQELTERGHSPVENDCVEVVIPFSASYTEGDIAATLDSGRRSEKRVSEGNVMSCVRGREEGRRESKEKENKKNKDRQSKLGKFFKDVFGLGHSRPSTTSIDSDDYNPSDLPSPSSHRSRSVSSTTSSLLIVNAARAAIPLSTILASGGHHNSPKGGGRSPDTRNGRADTVSTVGVESDERKTGKGWIQSTGQTRSYIRGGGPCPSSPSTPSFMSYVTSPSYSVLSSHQQRPIGPLSSQQPLYPPSHQAPPTPSSSSSASATPSSAVGIDDHFPPNAVAGPYILLQDTEFKSHPPPLPPKLPPRRRPENHDGGGGCSTDSRSELSMVVPVDQVSPAALPAGSIAQRRSRTASSSTMDSPTSSDHSNTASNAQYIHLGVTSSSNGTSSSSSAGPYLHLSGPSSSGASLSSTGGTLNRRRDSSPEYIENPSYAPYKKMEPDRNCKPPTVAPKSIPPIPPRSGVYAALNK